MNETDDAVKIKPPTHADLFEGIKGRRPKNTEELTEWLDTPEGRAAAMFEPTSLSPWGEKGRS
jgi:hypothetical protein